MSRYPQGNRVKNTLLLILAGTLAGACDSGQEPFRYLALGDSYTIGEGVSPDERWPVQLSALLQKQQIVEAPTILAKTGWTTGELLEVIQNEPPRGPFGLVTLLIGVNNQYRGYPIEIYRQEFRQLLDLAIEFADADPSRVLVPSIPDWGVTPFAEDHDQEKIAKEIDQFNQVNREESVARAVRYLDITSLSRNADDDGTMLSADGLHPSGKMYQQWARLAFDRIRSEF
jgi:lysophospholipase L1-like esterase